jgi:hypothetical protein
MGAADHAFLPTRFGNKSPVLSRVPSNPYIESAFADALFEDESQSICQRQFGQLLTSEMINSPLGLTTNASDKYDFRRVVRLQALDIVENLQI